MTLNPKPVKVLSIKLTSMSDPGLGEWFLKYSLLMTIMFPRTLCVKSYSSAGSQTGGSLDAPNKCWNGLKQENCDMNTSTNTLLGKSVITGIEISLCPYK